MPETEVGNPIALCESTPIVEKKEEEKQVIKFMLTDDGGKPLKDILLSVTLPDESIEEKVSDIDGMIEIINLTGGNCKLESDWKTLKVDDVVLIQ